MLKVTGSVQYIIITPIAAMVIYQVRPNPFPSSKSLMQDHWWLFGPGCSALVCFSPLFFPQYLLPTFTLVLFVSALYLFLLLFFPFPSHWQRRHNSVFHAPRNSGHAFLCYCRYYWQYGKQTNMVTSRWYAVLPIKSVGIS